MEINGFKILNPYNKVFGNKSNRVLKNDFFSVGARYCNGSTTITISCPA